MTDKITLGSISSFQNDTTATAQYNANNALLTTAIDNTLSRDGTSPNQMNSTLDMNSNTLINLSNPSTANSPLRLQDLNKFIGGGTVSSLPTGGTTGQVLTKTSNADFATNWSINSVVAGAGALTGTTLAANVVNSSLTTLGSSPTLTTPTINTPTISNPTVTGSFTAPGLVTNAALASATITGASVAANTVANSNLTQSGAATLKGNPTNATANVTDFTIQGLTNNVTPSVSNDKVPIYNNSTGTIQYSTPGQLFSSGTAGVSSLNGLTGGLSVVGTNGIGVTPSGSTVTLSLGALTASSVTFSPTTGGVVGTTTNNNTTAGNVGEYVSSNIVAGSAVNVSSNTPTDITSISLTAGDWQVWGTTSIQPSLVTTKIGHWINTTSATTPADSGNGAVVFHNYAGALQSGATIQEHTGQMRLSLSGTTTVYLSCNVTISTGTVTAYGFLGARRVR